ncbi:MAG: c-type cytochrome [Nitrospinota bacterium]|nr:c-type cytochrome [Nitrospinota bacterium]
MRFLITVSFFTALLFAIPISAISHEPIRPLGEKISSGHTLFHMHGCSTYHSVKGKGGAQTGPDLGRVTLWASPVLGAAVMWNHVPIMSKTIKEKKLKWPRFKGKEIGDIFTYLNSLNRRPGAGVVFRANTAHGKSFFDEIGCRTCHGPPFGGGHYGPDLGEAVNRLGNVNAFSTRMLRHAPMMLERAKREKIHWPQLNGHQISSIFAYLESIAVARKP